MLRRSLTQVMACVGIVLHCAGSLITKSIYSLLNVFVTPNKEVSKGMLKVVKAMNLYENDRGIRTRGTQTVASYKLVCWGFGLVCIYRQRMCTEENLLKIKWRPALKIPSRDKTSLVIETTLNSASFVKLTQPRSFLIYVSGNHRLNLLISLWVNPWTSPYHLRILSVFYKSGIYWKSVS